MPPLPNGKGRAELGESSQHNHRHENQPTRLGKLQVFTSCRNKPKLLKASTARNEIQNFSQEHLPNDKNWPGAAYGRTAF
ncbi:unnamed protein product [Prunus armeniaca]|uniref:Uncharacterized protein n=1 Tax=Prunus armeniaca TaxID=36596 RepID=A0A6J5TJU9_PRUAR|nr:unnamed protein product [Prunus armeniaca]